MLHVIRSKNKSEPLSSSSVNIKHVNTNYVAVSSGFIMYRLNDDSKFPQRSISAVFKCFSHPGLPGRTASVCCCRDAILIRARGFVVYGELVSDKTLNSSCHD